MTRCLLLVNGANYDVTNLMNEEGLCRYMNELRLQAHRQQLQQQQQQQQQRRRGSSQQQRSRRPSSTDFDWNVPLYPNLSDPCNRRLLRDVEIPEWKSVPLVKEPTAASEETSDKYAEFYELQRRDMERMQQQHQAQQQQVDFSQAADLMTSLPQRAQTAPLHSAAGNHQQQHHNNGITTAPASPGGACSLPPSFSPQTTTAGIATNTQGGLGGLGLGGFSSHTTHTSRQSLPPVRRPQRHSTTAVPGDIDSSSSGLRPRVNYKALYSRNRNLSGSSQTAPTVRSSISGGHYGEEEDDTSTTMMGSSRQSFSTYDQSYDDTTPHSMMMEEPGEESPVEEDEPAPAPPATMEIAPNVRVAVRSSQETYKAVQSGDYTVATCFACTATIVCVDDAAYVLCPDCQVVSPLCFGGGAGSPHDASKKDDPYGIGTGLKREWVNEWVGSI